MQLILSSIEEKDCVVPLIISHSLYEPHIRESLRRIAGLKILKIIKPLKLQEKTRVILKPRSHTMKRFITHMDRSDVGQGWTCFSKVIVGVINCLNTVCRWEDDRI